MTLRILFATIIIIGSLFSQAQNVGINAANPTEKLEVGGMIYTNQGGVKFPDETIQTTAAFSEPPETYPEERGVGFIWWGHAELDGNLDTLDMTKLSLLYEFSIDNRQEFEGGLVFGDFVLRKQTDKGSPGLLKYLILQTAVSNVQMYLTRPDQNGDLEIYYRIKLTNAKVQSHNPGLQPGLDGYYQHTDLVRLSYQTITLHDLITNKCYCWNVVTNTSCTCN